MVSPSPLSGFSRVTVASSRTRADVAVPSTIPVASFMPVLLRHVGESLDTAGAQHGGWGLRHVDGREVDLARNMDANQVRDGDVLVLHPLHEPLAEPLYDDVVEVVGRNAVGDRWSGRDRRIAAGVLGSLALGLALGCLVAAPRTTVLTAVLAVAGAVLLLFGGAALSRAAGDLAAGGVVAAWAGPFAACGAALFLDQPWGRERVLIGCAALLVVAAVLPALVGGWEAVAGAYAIAGGLTGIGALIVVVADVSPARAAAAVAPAALALTTVLPTLSLRLARLPRPQLALTAAELAELPAEVEQERTRDRVAAARRLMTGLMTGALAVTAGGAAVLFADRGSWTRLLAGVLILLVLLRSRLFAARAPVLVSVCVVAAAGAVGAAVLLRTAATRDALLPSVLPAAAGVALVCLLVGVTTDRWTASPRLRRLTDTVETLLLVSVAPLVLGVWHVYSTLFHLGG